MVTRYVRGRQVMIDEADAPLLDASGWTINSGGYVVRQVSHMGTNHIALLHRIVICAPAHSLVDHIDGDPLNNQRSNLRLASHAENMRNSKTHKNNRAGLKGVYMDHPPHGTWTAQVRCDGVIYRQHGFPSKEAAHEWYVRRAKELHQEFSRAA